MTLNDETDLALDPDLMAYVDGRLSPEKLTEVEARLSRDAQAREAVAQWRHFDNVLHNYAKEADDLPANLRIAALERQLADKLRKRHWRAKLLGPGLQRIAASVFLFAAGWGGHALYSGGADTITASYPYFVAPTLAGHSFYSLAGYERAEFAGDEVENALDWISAQMQQKIDSPKLGRLGYRVESARLVMIEGQPVALFNYRNPEDERVTVSLTPRGVADPQYGLRVASVDKGSMAYWTSNSLHYAVVAETDSARITTLAAAIED